jgi:DNA-binding IclR family transcriptional regulator
MIRGRESKSAPVGVLGKVLRILETLDRSGTGLPLGQIAALTSPNKSTAYGFLAHLENEDDLFRDESGSYVSRRKLARLGTGLAYHATLRSISRPVLLSVAEITDETANLGPLDTKRCFISMWWKASTRSAWLHTPACAALLRNFPVRQPVLWVQRGKTRDLPRD